MTKDNKKLLYDPLIELMNYFSAKPAEQTQKAVSDNLPMEEQLKKHIIDGEKQNLEEHLRSALEKHTPLYIINTILLEGMRVVGELFGKGEMQLPFVLQSAEVMKKAVAFLEPFMEKQDAVRKGTLVLATVKGDVHDIGKNLVDIILTNNGYRVINLGIKCPVETMIHSAEEHKADAIGMSGLLVKSTLIMKENLEVMTERQWSIPVLLGGAALTKRYVDEDLRSVYAGSVHYCEDAFSGLRVMEDIYRGEHAPQTADVDPLEQPAASVKELIKRWKIVRHKWNKTLGYIADDDFKHGVHFGSWTLRDILAHLTGWERMLLDELSQQRDAYRPSTWTPERINDQNRQFASEQSGKEKHELIDHWNRIQQDFIAFLEQNNASLAGVLSSGNNLREFSELTYQHEYEHWKKVSAWLMNPAREKILSRNLPKKSPKVHPAENIPQPPFWGSQIVRDVTLDTIFPYINDIALFRGQWQFTKGSLTEEAYQALIRDTVRPVLHEWTSRAIRENLLIPTVVYGYFPCQSDGDDLIIYRDDLKTERLRFTFPRQPDEPYLCISDFFADCSSGKMDTLGCHIVTVGELASEFSIRLFENNQYSDYLYFHGLSVETAEALAEFWHREIRKELHIDSEDSEDIRKLFQQHYRGSRYSFGYPACPNLEDQVKLFELLRPERIGVKLSEGYQLHPEQSTSAIIVHHPQAKYFNVR